MANLCHNSGADMENLVLCLILSPVLLLPLAMKWELDLRLVAPAALAVGLLSGILLNLIPQPADMNMIQRVFAGSGMILLFSAALLLARFYRDPERAIPETDGIVLCPADGVVKYIRPIEYGTAPCSSKGAEHAPLPPAFMEILSEGKGRLIGIGMSFLDVHVTRAPVTGTVSYLEHVEGDFLSLKLPAATSRNERVNMVIENGKYGIGVIHIASRLVRRIVMYADRGERLTMGQRIGMIRFGSQVDVLLPEREGLRIRVEVGEKVKAGETVLASLDAA